MFWMLLFLWVILNGRVSVEVLSLGVALSALICLFASKYMGYSPQSDGKLLRKIPGFVRYCALLLFEIIKANRDVMRLILSPRYETEPQIITVHVPLKTGLSRVMLANSITLTPGTITVSLRGDQYMIHCLDRTLGEGIAHSAFVKRLRELEDSHG